MALYGPSMMQGLAGLGGLAGGMTGGGNMVDGGWPGGGASRRATKVRGSNPRMEQMAKQLPAIMNMFAPKQNNPAQAALGMATAENLPMLMRWMGFPSSTKYGTHTTAGVVQPGQTQVIRPSAQQPARRAAAPQAGASSSLITSTPSPAEVALATTSLLGG